MNRLCIYTKDVQLITGKGERQSREIIKQIKLLKNKTKHQVVTIQELSEYLGLNPADIGGLLR